MFFPSFRFFYLHYTLNLFPSFFYNLLACVVEVEEGIFLFADELLRAAVEEKLKMPWGRNFTRKNHCRVYPRSSFNPFVCAPVCVCVRARASHAMVRCACASTRLAISASKVFDHFCSFSLVLMRKWCVSSIPHEWRWNHRVEIRTIKFTVLREWSFFISSVVRSLIQSWSIGL